MMFRVIFTGLVASIALAACSHFSSVAPSRTFSMELSKQYSALSINDERSDYKWLSTHYFAKKADRAGRRIDVQPEDPATWNVPREYRPELKNAYDMLQIALIPDNKKNLTPVAAADAQAYFDCWVEQAHKKWTPTAKTNDCRAAFYQAFCSMYGGKCSAAINSDHIFRLYFDTNRYDVKPEGKQSIQGAAAVFRKGATEVIVAGHADRVGNPKANEALSRARAEEVRHQLVKAGVPAHKIVVKYFGEKLPVVPTGDNVSNGNNRRVLIVVR